MRVIIKCLMVIMLVISMGCAGRMVKEGLLADYFLSSVNGAGFGKTESYHPQVDFQLVIKDRMDGDGINIVMVWIDQINNGAAMAWDHLDKEGSPNVCGVLRFRSKEDLESFLGGNTMAVADGRNVDCEALYNELDRQLRQDPVKVQQNI